MPNLDVFNDLYPILNLAIPGIVVLFVRSQFVQRRSSPTSRTLLKYCTVTAIYYALVFLLVDPVLPITINSDNVWAWFCLIFAGPAVLGLLLGINIQKNLFHRMLQYCRLKLVHAVPTAWDWKFGYMAPQWVFATLKDGTSFAGFFGPESFMSSDPEERDIYIQWVYDILDDHTWSVPDKSKGVLIAAGEIQSIEFWPYTSQENENAQG